MPNHANLPIVADRYGACVRHIYVVGLDLTGLDMRAQVRLYGDTPGAPLVDLRVTANGNAEGLRLVEVTSDGAGVPTSHVELVVNETTIEGLPYVGEIGEPSQFRWDWQVTIAGRKRRLASGAFEITGDGVTGADVAPSQRVHGTGRPRQPIADVWSSARLTFGEEQVTVQIDGADLIAPLAKKATDAATRAEAGRDAAQLASATALAASRYFRTKAAGEAASAVDQLFSTDDGTGNLIYYRRATSGSVEIGRAVTPALLAAPDGSTRLTYQRAADSALHATTYAPLALNCRPRPTRNKLQEQLISVTDWGAFPDFTDQSVNLQRAIDECPMGCTLFFPTPNHPDYIYVTERQLDVRRRINLASDGGARLVGRFATGDITSDLLNINHVNPQDADSRGWWIEGFRGLSMASNNGRHAINIYTGNGSVFNGNFRIANIREIAVGHTSSGVAINIENAPGCELQHAAIEHCYVTNGVRLTNTTDGIKLIDVKSGGMKAGLVIDLRAGAFQTIIRDCLFTNRDCGIIVYNGDLIVVDACHFEQFVDGSWPGGSINQGPFGAQLLIYGQSGGRPCRNIVVSRTNFGGGTNGETPLVLAGHVRDVVVEACQWRRGGSGNDMSILEPTVKGTVVMPVQFPNGVRSNPDPGYPLRVLDKGVATRGVPKVGADLTFQSSWSAGPGFAWSVDEAGRVHLDGALLAGTGTLNELITTLPEGYRPRLDTTLTCSNATDNMVVRLRVGANGSVQLAGPAPVAGTPVFLNVSYRGKIRDTYETGIV